MVLFLPFEIFLKFGAGWCGQKTCYRNPVVSWRKKEQQTSYPSPASLLSSSDYSARRRHLQSPNSRSRDPQILRTDWFMEAFLPCLHRTSWFRWFLHCHRGTSGSSQPWFQENTLPSPSFLQSLQCHFCQEPRVGWISKPGSEIRPHLNTYQHTFLHSSSKARASPCRSEHQFGGVPWWPACSSADPKVAQVCGYNGDVAWTAGPARLLGGFRCKAASWEGQDIAAGEILTLDSKFARRWVFTRWRILEYHSVLCAANCENSGQGCRIFVAFVSALAAWSLSRVHYSLQTQWQFVEWSEIICCTIHPFAAIYVACKSAMNLTSLDDYCFQNFLEKLCMEFRIFSPITIRQKSMTNHGVRLPGQTTIVNL